MLETTPTIRRFWNRRQATGALLALALLPLGLATCTKSQTPAPAGDPYAYVAPPTTAPPAGMDPATWLSHEQSDLLPFWTMTEAQGSPVGNFPTWRGMDGSLQNPTNRKPRMMGRQVFAYCAAFLMTGDETYLDLARAGDRWLLDHARDVARGGWFADL